MPSLRYNALAGQVITAIHNHDNAYYISCESGKIFKFVHSVHNCCECYSVPTAVSTCDIFGKKIRNVVAETNNALLGRNLNTLRIYTQNAIGELRLVSQKTCKNTMELIDIC